jgi:hypothetical protein
MLEIPWRTFRAPNANGVFVALLPTCPLETYWRVLPWATYTVQVVKQLATADGFFWKFA